MKEKIIFFALLSLTCAHIDPLPWQYPPDYCMYCKRIMKLTDNLATGTLPFTIDRLRNATGNLCSLIEDPTLLNFRATVSSLHISSLIQGFWKFGYRDMTVESPKSYNNSSKKRNIGVSMFTLNSARNVQIFNNQTQNSSKFKIKRKKIQFLTNYCFLTILNGRRDRGTPTVT